MVTQPDFHLSVAKAPKLPSAPTRSVYQGHARPHVTISTTAVDPADGELIRQALAGAQQAYREILRRYQQPVFSLIMHMVRERTAAEDLTQEAFAKAFAALRSYDSTRKFSSWLFKIAHNHAVDRLRRTRPDLVSLEGSAEAESWPAEIASPEKTAEREELADAMRAALNRLRIEYREALVLRYQEGLSQQEIADVMGITEGTAKTYLHRGRKALAAEMTARGWGGRV